MSLSPKLLGVVALCDTLPVWSQTLTVRELVAKAEQTNQDVAAVRQRVEEEKGLLRQAGVRPAPTIDASGATGRVLGTIGEEQFSAGLSKTLETGGKRSLTLSLGATEVHEDQVRF